MTGATGWEELLGTALVGTGRRAFALDTVAVADLGPLGVTGAEETVLAAAAVLAGYRRAGWTPPTWDGEPAPPAKPDPRPECSATAAQILELLLDRTIRVEGGPEMLIRRWLTACVEVGQRPPYGQLVALLGFGTSHPPTRDLVRAAAGTRGAWLATHNPQWTWAAPVPAEQVVERFATGTRADRTALLTELRTTEPEFARTLIEDTWDDEQAAARAGLLDTLAVGLSAADEPLLESALDDRAASVRAAAAALLDRLPDSARAARMAKRATRLVHGNTAELPDEPDAAARRDGITDQREPGYGLRASWLIQILAGTPLSTWDPTAATKAEPELLTGWTKAALRQRNQDWLAAIARRRPAPELIAALRPDTATDILAQQKKLDPRFGGLLAACPGPWPAEFSTTILNRLRAARADAVLTLAGPALAEHLHPSALAVLEAWLTAAAEERKPARRALRGVAHAVTIRATINQEFS